MNCVWKLQEKEKADPSSLRAVFTALDFLRIGKNNKELIANPWKKHKLKGSF